MYDFYVGQRVECVDASGLGADDGILMKGGRYTIRWFGVLGGPAPWPHEAFDFSVRLQEIRRGYDRHFFGNEEVPFAATRFRPLIETYISVFTAMLNTAPVEREPVNA